MNFFKAWALVLSLALSAGSVQVAWGSEVDCDALMKGQADRTLRDLSYDKFSERLVSRWMLSELAAQRLRASVEGGEFFTKRSELVRFLVENPGFLEKAERALQATKDSSIFLVDTYDKSKVKLEELARVYKEFTPVTSAIAAFFGFVPVAIVNAVHFAMRGTREHNLAERARVWIQTSNAAHKLITGKTIAGRLLDQVTSQAQKLHGKLPEPLREMTGMAAQGVGAAAVFAYEQIQVASVQGRKLGEETYAQALEQIRNLKAELEVSTMFAKMALEWRERGLPITRGEWVEQSIPLLMFEEVHHIPLLAETDFKPFSISLESTSPGGVTVLLTGSHGSGKTSFLESVEWGHTMIRIGGYVPAKQFKSAKSVLLTSIFGGVNSNSGESLSQAQVRELTEVIGLAKMSTIPVLILIDEVGSGLEPGARRALVQEFRGKLNGSVMLVLATNSSDVANDVGLSGAKTVRTSFGTGGDVLQEGEIYQFPDGSSPTRFFPQ